MDNAVLSKPTGYEIVDNLKKKLLEKRKSSDQIPHEFYTFITVYRDCKSRKRQEKEILKFLNYLREL